MRTKREPNANQTRTQREPNAKRREVNANHLPADVEKHCLCMVKDCSVMVIAEKDASRKET